MERPPWFDEMIAEMVERGLLVSELDYPMRFSKPGAKYKLDLSRFSAPADMPDSEEIRHGFMLTLLTLAEDPTLGEPVRRHRRG